MWTLINALLDANPVRQQAMPPSESQIVEELAAQTEGDLGEIGEDEAENSDEDEEDMGANPNEVKVKKHRIRAASQNKALLLIVSCL